MPNVTERFNEVMTEPLRELIEMQCDADRQTVINNNMRLSGARLLGALLFGIDPEEVINMWTVGDMVALYDAEIAPYGL